MRDNEKSRETPGRGGGHGGGISGGDASGFMKAGPRLVKQVLRDGVLVCHELQLSWKMMHERAAGPDVPAQFISSPDSEDLTPCCLRHCWCSLCRMSISGATSRAPSSPSGLLQPATGLCCQVLREAGSSGQPASLLAALRDTSSRASSSHHENIVGGEFAAFSSSSVALLLPDLPHSQPWRDSADLAEI